MSRWVVALLVAGTPLAAQAPAAAPRQARWSAAESTAVEQLGEKFATSFALIDSWYQGHPIQYYDFGRDAARPAILYRIKGGSDIVTTLPGLPGYTALRVVYLVEPAAGQAVQAIRSHLEVEELARRGLVRIEGPGTVINAPIVPQGSHLDRDPADRLVKGAWYQGYRVSYYDFGTVVALPIPLAAFTSGFDANGDAVLVDGQPSNASAIPGVPGYSDMWRIRFLQVSARFQPGSYRDYRQVLADARNGRLKLIDPGFVVNCPVVYVDGRPAAR